MKLTGNTLKRDLTEIILIFVFGGLVNAYLTCRICFTNWHFAVQFWYFCGMSWVLLWKGNEIITCRLDTFISWVNKPVKRFLIGLISMLVYTAGVSTLNTWVFVEYIKSPDLNMSFRTVIIPVITISVGITVIIMLIFLSKGFLESWRQAAINEEKLRRENIASQYEALKNQVNPHFLFNTLNALSSLIYEDREKAVEFLNRFSEVYRYVLDSKDKEVVPLHNEIDFLKSYLFLLNSRYEKNLEVDLDETLKEGYVPPMAVQLLVENAVKHNIIADNAPLRISIRKENENIVVVNNMNPKNESQNKNGIGIENIQSRYSILSGQPVTIINDGSIFSVSIPILSMTTEKQ